MLRPDQLWCKSNPRVQRAWDAHSLALYQRDPWSYYQTMIRGWRQDNPVFKYGRLIHTGLGALDVCKIKGLDKEAAISDVLQGILPRVLDYQARDTARTPWTLMRAIVDYADHWYDSKLVVPVPLDPDEPTSGVEAQFQMELPIKTPDGDNYVLCGSLDSIVRFEKKLYALERKHTISGLNSFYISKYSLGVQVIVYDFALSRLLPSKVRFGGVMLDFTQIGVQFTRFSREEVPSSPELRSERERMICSWIKRAERDALCDDWPINWNNTVDKWGITPFKDALANPRRREELLKAQFKRDFWNPLETHED